MAPAIKNALDMARKENVKPPAVLEKSDKEYKRLKQSADLLKTEDDKKVIIQYSYDKCITNSRIL